MKGRVGGSIKHQADHVRKDRFVVHIHCRENATWQGKVLWVDQNRQCSFRSALELLKLIDGALGNNDKEEDSDIKQDK